MYWICREILCFERFYYAHNFSLSRHEQKKIRIIIYRLDSSLTNFFPPFSRWCCSSPSRPSTTRPSPAPWSSAVPTVRASIMRPVALMTIETLMVGGIPVANTILGPVSVVPSTHGSAVLVPSVGVMMVRPASCEMMRASSAEHRLLFMRVAVMVVGISFTSGSISGPAALSALPAPGGAVSGVSPWLPLDRRRLAWVWIFLFPAFVPGQNNID